MRGVFFFNGANLPPITSYIRDPAPDRPLRVTKSDDVVPLRSSVAEIAWPHSYETADRSDGCEKVKLSPLPLTGCVLAATLLAGGCAVIPPASRERLATACDQYQRKDYRSSAAALDAFLQEHPDRRESAEAYYLRSLCMARLSNKSRAAADALQCIKYTDDQALRAKAHVNAGTLLMETGNSADALPHYAAALHHLPEAPPTDVVRYQYAVCLRREGRWKEAKQEAGLVLQRYPRSNVVDAATKLRDWPEDHFTIQCGVYRDEASAAAHRDELNKAGQRARLLPRTRGGERLVSVVVGVYPRYDQAKAALPAIKQKAPNASIVP